MRARLASQPGTSSSQNTHTNGASQTPPIHFYSSSGGNAGLAAVHAARSLGHPCTVVVPLTTQPLMIAKIREAGAHDVIQTGESWREADTYLREELIERDPGGVYCPPFDHPDVWAGNATLSRELAGQWRDGGKEGRKLPAAIVCSVGGGGLLCGLMQGLHEVGEGWDGVPVIALETVGADSLNQSVKADELVTLPGITSAARCLGATRVASRAFEWATGRAPQQKGKTQIINATLTDAEAAMGCWKLAETEKMIVEMACGVNVAVCFGHKLERILGRKLGEDEEVVVVVCGGSDITLEGLVDMKARYADEVAAL